MHTGIDMSKIKSVDDYIDNARYWPAELKTLRKILIGVGLDEAIKWGGPCYTHEGKNVVGLGAFKAYVGFTSGYGFFRAPC